MFSAYIIASIWTLLRYPHPPLNQSSYTIFSFHRLAGFLPHLASYFFGDGKPLRAVVEDGLQDLPHLNSTREKSPLIPLFQTGT
jgi:hypothetical protein